MRDQRKRHKVHIELSHTALVPTAMIASPVDKGSEDHCVNIQLHDPPLSVNRAVSSLVHRKQANKKISDIYGNIKNRTNRQMAFKSLASHLIAE